jgi:primosomal protein N' (replication factor Y)
LEYRNSNSAEAEKQANILADRLKTEWTTDKTEKRRMTDLIGPVPCFFTKINGIYRWQIVLRGPDPVNFLQGKILAGWRVEVDPVSLL